MVGYVGVCHVSIDAPASKEPVFDVAGKDYPIVGTVCVFSEKVVSAESGTTQR